MSQKNINLQLQINGEEKTYSVPAFTRLLDLLRNQAELTGTKEGCGEGECGACSVLMDGELVNSCLIPVAQCQNTQIETIESLANEEELHPLQSAFLEKGGAQCGICTPGMVMAAYSLLKQNPKPTDDEIREGLSGNLCRCTGYIKIIDSVRYASQHVKKELP